MGKVRRAKPKLSGKRSARSVRRPQLKRSLRVSDARLYERVAEILEQARGQVVRTINTAMVQTYWLIGREVVEVEQAGEQRAGYGEEIIQKLAVRLMSAYGKGFSAPNLRRMRRFIKCFRLVQRFQRFARQCRANRARAEASGFARQCRANRASQDRCDCCSRRCSAGPTTSS
jgi:hypothetical protein